MSQLDRWDSFYVIVGSSAGALIGLQFVVITLIAERPPLRAAEAGATFATPTIVYFSTTLLLSALQRVPWPSIIVAAALWGLIGLTGVVYAIIVGRRMRVQTTYQPEFEDGYFIFCSPWELTVSSRYRPSALPPTRKLYAEWSAQSVHCGAAVA